jgi:membrane fusion protein (multidrug efflux system)
MEDTGRPVTNHRRKIVALVVFTFIAVIGIIAVYFYLRYKATHIATDDAFIDGHIHTIASKVSGTVKAIYVNDNQYVKSNDLIMEIDEVDYDVRVKGARAELDKEIAKLSEIRNSVETNKTQFGEITANLEAAKADLELQQANLRQADIDLKRAENLFKKEAISKERYDRTRTSYDVASAQVKAAKERVKQFEASLETQKAIIKQTESSLLPQKGEIGRKDAALKIAELNRSYAKIYAPSDGYITKRSAEVGNQIQTGQPLMAIVPLEDIWVTANYKETQLKKVKPGQKVQLSVDTYSGRIFHGKSVFLTGENFVIFRQGDSRNYKDRNRNK